MNVDNDVGGSGGQRIPTATHWIGDGGFKSAKPTVILIKVLGDINFVIMIVGEFKGGKREEKKLLKKISSSFTFVSVKIIFV